MPKSIIYSFTFLYLLAMLRPIQPVLNYYLNQEFIAEFLCENKDKPELNCNGKCHLIKEVKQQNNSEKPVGKILLMENYPIGFVSLLDFTEKNIRLVSIAENTISAQDHYAYQFHFSSFHPPKL